MIHHVRPHSPSRCTPDLRAANPGPHPNWHSTSIACSHRFGLSTGLSVSVTSRRSVSSDRGGGFMPMFLFCKHTGRFHTQTVAGSHTGLRALSLAVEETPSEPVATLSVFAQASLTKPQPYRSQIRKKIPNLQAQVPTRMDKCCSEP